MDKSFKLVRRFQYPSEALIFQGKLESEGIQVFSRDINTINSNPLLSNAIGGVKLFVKAEDYERANKVLSEISKFSLDENNKLLKCPNCDAEEIEMVTSIKDIKTIVAFVLLLYFAMMPLYSKHKYKCSNCNFEFN
ncbi:putative signal transducing protein [Flavobacterium johnsoniae]|uniref:DUF2007 domain-containing protein n=1 Tax=Flavobacterium johnsoniae (strain ATCC 17061 / DSM 2064 / JCM 8514 / BCRC 14874 / CCUG 350202 / NBRC 14942 / NCIMB 11054 / UW101) TaxID=376686 RepID=A5FLR5_FLAJ1|nr:DUF2007 domain-containing protein [Flavobacterium johnsoniae]ABQ03847.1 hypothetical protein Fjoh_0813 [Flavobacterium johnsoniae UW101]OXE96293.1 hypothetical protein B0A63_22465 [Flavobacterium johnsoniae UW101]WQG79288.1 DUF2007 domain-containing protein [Flavobacterium johnsoniae UW101]SHK04536.1 Putative signal transducing protein [Flavobacterium johnsoniae]